MLYVYLEVKCFIFSPSVTALLLNCILLGGGAYFFDLAAAPF